MPELTARTLRPPAAGNRRLLVGQRSSTMSALGACAAFVQSPHAHALVSCVDSSACEPSAGRRRRLTDADLVARQPNLASGSVLAGDEVVYVGQPVAVVLAGNKTPGAEDGAEMVDVDYEPLRSVVGIDAAARY